jgi:hypothetical protein
VGNLLCGHASDLRTTVTNQNLIQEEIKRRGNACYHSVQNLLSFHLLSKNIKIRIHKTIIFLWFCMSAKLVPGIKEEA